MRLQLKGLLLAAVAVASLPALALPSTSVSWVQQSGTAGPDETVQVWVRLTVDAAAQAPLILDGSAASFSAADLAGLSSIDSILGTSGSGGCWANGALGNCGTASFPWRFDPNMDKQTGLIGVLPGISIAPGASHDFLFGTLTPVSGSVAPGTYGFAGAELALQVNGTLDGALVGHELSLGTACDFQNPACAFTRTILAVPEPSSYGLMALGLGLLVVRLRGRRA